MEIDSRIQNDFWNRWSAPSRDDYLIGFDVHVVVNDELVRTDKLALRV